MYLAHRLAVPILFPIFFQKVFEGRDWACSPLGKRATDIPDLSDGQFALSGPSVGDFRSSTAGLRWGHFYRWGTWAVCSDAQPSVTYQTIY